MSSHTPEQVTVYQKGRIRIVRKVSGYCHPRNGNAHNPTPRYRWEEFGYGPDVCPVHSA